MYRILVIDDEEDLLIPLSRLLQKNGFEVVTLSRASTVFKIVEAFKPDLILMDIKLHDLDGRDVCWELKAHPKTSIIKVILCSAYLSKKHRYVEYGADDFIEKPFEYKALIKKINFHLKDED